MTEQDKQALIKHYCERDCGEAAKDCMIMPCHEIELIQEFPTTEADSDTISRQAAIEALRKMQTYKLFSGDDMLLIDQAGTMTELMLLPSAQPKRGKWILDRSGAYCCSECMEPCAGYVMMKPRDKFCKMCGAKMEVTT